MEEKKEKEKYKVLPILIFGIMLIIILLFSQFNLWNGVVQNLSSRLLIGG